MNKTEVNEIIELHQRLDVRTQHTVQFLFKILGINQKELSLELSLSSAYIRQVIRGERNPPERFKKVLLKRLGVDIWPYVELDKARQQT